MTELSEFMYPHSYYHGEATPQNLAFNSGLQEFSQKISYICNLEMAGKVSPEEAYKEIKRLWEQLQQLKKELGIGDPLPGETALDKNTD